MKTLILLSVIKKISALSLTAVFQTNHFFNVVLLFKIHIMPAGVSRWTQNWTRWTTTTYTGFRYSQVPFRGCQGQFPLQCIIITYQFCFCSSQFPMWHFFCVALKLFSRCFRIGQIYRCDYKR